MTIGKLSSILDIRVRRVQEALLCYQGDIPNTLIRKCVLYTSRRNDPILTRTEIEYLYALINVDERVSKVIDEILDEEEKQRDVF